MAAGNNNDNLLRIILIVLAAIILAPLLMMVLAVPFFGMWGGMMGSIGGTGGGSMWGVGMAIVWLVIILGGGYLVVRWLAGSEAGRSDPALEELRLAYARGEITDEEFDERRAKLNRD